MISLNISQSQRKTLISALMVYYADCSRNGASLEFLEELTSLCELLCYAQESPKNKNSFSGWKAQCNIAQGKANNYWYVESPDGKYWLSVRGVWKEYTEKTLREMGNFRTDELAAEILSKAHSPP